MRLFIVFLSLFFSTLSFAEKYKTGLIVPKNWKEKAKFESAKTLNLAVPADFDWRTQKTLSPIMNQGNCGSCWDFSASATFRDALVVQLGNAYVNSTQQVLDCNSQGYGCNGGFFDVGEYFVSPGVSTENDYGAYTAKKQSCKKGVPVTAKAGSWAYVAQQNGAPSDSEIKAAIYQYGPVSVGVAADSNFQNYTSGVFSNCTARQLNHAVQLVGWSDSGGYWIMRNSWGTNWGEQGYMRLKYGCNGIGEAANFFKMSDAPNPPPPNPTPTPTPSPKPDPCPEVDADTGYGDEFQVVVGEKYLLGSKAQKGVSYVWTAEPPFDKNAQPKSAQIVYKPIITKKLTVTASNKCGKTSSASTLFTVDEISWKVFR